MVLELLTGTFHRSLDDKCRLAIPKPLREALGQPEKTVMFLAPGTDGSLALYTESGFADLGQQLAHGSPIGQNVRAFSRLFYGQAQRVEVDRQGRLRIPQSLMQLAGCHKEVVLLGVRDHLEIWDKTRWDAYLNQTQPHYDLIAERAFDGASAPAETAASVEISNVEMSKSTAPRPAESATTTEEDRPPQPR